MALAGRRRLAGVFNYRFAGPVVYVTNVMTQPGVASGYAVSDYVRVRAEHVGPVLTDVLGHSGNLTPEHLVRYATEQAALVEVDREVLWAMGLRVREAGLLSEDAVVGDGYDPGRLVKEVCEDALVRL
jgi:2-phospho-L-lactate transferase/gluconeogenesis factor (CofD/UPF0052 family)